MILLQNVTIVDGTGSKPRAGDLLIDGARIAEAGPVEASGQFETVDCTGLHVVPGFVDVHSHSDHEVIRHLPNKVLQGITTEVVGNCGISMFPTHPRHLQGNGELFGRHPENGMNGAGEYFESLESGGSRVNVASLLGNGTLREYVMAMRADAATEDEMRKMERTLDQSLEGGAIGLSSGLNILPSSFASIEELIRLCGTVRKHNAYYATHMRDYKFRVLEAIDEAIAIGHGAGVPVQISHMQVVGQKNWSKLEPALERIETARAGGLDIEIDAYPYLAGSCSIIQLLPGWCQDGGVPKLLEWLSSPTHRDRIARETDDYMSNTWDDIVICYLKSEANQAHVGKSIARIAAERGRPAPATVMDLLEEESGSVFIISFNNNEANLARVLCHPLTSVITDGLVTEGLSHPRTYGTYPKFFGEYVREKKLMPLEQAVVKTSAQAARRFRMRDRGQLQKGWFADAVVFDAASIGTESDYRNPARDPHGIHHVLVNGQFAVRDGKLTDARAGVAVRHQGN
ncbi:MAG: N-acyl-D-amino-acid deacylase family protein [Bryobacteraceae bacterium]